MSELGTIEGVQGQRILTAGSFRLDCREGRLTRDGEVLALSGKPLALLEALMSAAPNLLTKEEIFERVWLGRAVSEAVLTTAIRQIRNALGDDARNPAFIETVHGRGYRDILELGVPFSDPMADGPVIQRSSERALRQGVSLAAVLGMVRHFRHHNSQTPLVLMGYANLIEAMGAEKFMAAAKDAGVDVVIVVDYPPEECESFAALARQAGIDPIFLRAPTSTERRIHEVARVGSGYLYYVSLRGVTGAGHIDLADVAAHIPKIRAATQLPIGVGFGIRDADWARRVAQTADAVVIGSRIIQEIEAAGAGQAVARVKALLRPIREALDA